MLELRPGVDRQEILPYCRQIKLPYSEALYVYRALDGSKVLAGLLFGVESNQVNVLYYQAEDEADHFLFDGLLRAGLGYADKQGISAGHIDDSFRQRHSALFSRLNLPPEATFNITNFFQKYKNCARLA